ncbi:MAG: hypothetical protein GWN56_13050, partial [Nitrosopumilaceae archaeon]|nr:hypothetical protein [Nitrosopumilaceae archaeon]
MDGTKEVIWGANSRNMYIGSTNFHQIEWESTDLDGPFSIDVFDVDNDATYEIVGASNSSNNGYDGG